MFAACITLCALAATAHAYDSWFERLGGERTLTRLFPDSVSRAEVHDGFLIGTGTESVHAEPDGVLRVERTRVYTRIRDTESNRIAQLPEPWHARSTLRVSPSLRLVSAETQLAFKRSADTVFPDHKLHERHEWLFDVDRTRLTAAKDGRRLTYQTFRGTKLVKSSTFDYPADAIPFELVSLFTSVAVDRRIDAFDFELLLPDGSTHGVRADTRRTRDLRKFAEGYRVPAARLRPAEPLAVVDMRLASPVKYLFFPHHFYMAFSVREPWKLMLLWGGDPDENLQAFRIE